MGWLMSLVLFTYVMYKVLAFLVTDPIEYEEKQREKKRKAKKGVDNEN
jgi:hypothetical protein|tara:strand:- start:7192 stop:7335 length:144 start_codon:yes stop_codon:yes gene_type:complete